MPSVTEVSLLFAFAPAGKRSSPRAAVPGVPDACRESPQREEHAPFVVAGQCPAILAVFDQGCPSDEGRAIDKQHRKW